MRRFPGIGIPLAFVLGLALAASLPAQDVGSYHYLEELKLRSGAKPYERLAVGTLFPSERTVYRDSITDAEVWKLTHDPAVVRHDYYDVPVWNQDGSMMLLDHQGGVTPNPNWLLTADGSSFLTRPESSIVSVRWSRVDPDLLYGLDGGQIVRFPWETWVAEPLFDFNTVVPPFDTSNLLLQPPHPVDDRLLFRTREQGRFFSFDLDLLQMTEIPTDGRWVVDDGIHRLRWTKDPDHNVFFGQNWVLIDGVPTLQPRQFIVPLSGAFDPLDECMLPGVEDRTGHPDVTMDGLAVTGFIDGDLWVYYCHGEKPSRTLYGATGGHHGSNSLDDRWYLIDNNDTGGYEVGGLDVSHSNVLLSMDGRAQMVLNYHYSLQADPLAYTEPRPASSPDGTKFVYDSNMMNRGVPGNEGNSDVYMVIVRRPFPPTDVNAIPGQGDVRISWSRPSHSPDGIHWNPGNSSFEISGYHVWRSDSSGGPYTQITDEPVVGTQYADAAVQPGTVYYYVVQSVEPSGLGSSFSVEDAASTTSSSWQGRVRHHFEAELAEIELPLVPQLGHQEVSGEWFVGTFAFEPDPVHPLESLPAAVNFDVRAPFPSSYLLWLRARSFSGAPATLDVRLDGGAQGSVVIDQDDWVWVPLSGSLPMSAGNHVLSVATADLEVGIDMIALTDDASYVPTGFAGGDTTAPAPPSNTRLVAVDNTTKKLVWDPSPDNDVQYYNVYCGRNDTYSLDNPNRLYSPLDTMVWDWGIPPGLSTVYKVTAVDRFGNESTPVVHDPAVSGEGRAPVAFDDFYTVDEDTVLAPGGIGVLENDQDLDGDVLTATLVQDVVNGSLTLFQDGSFTYTPDAEFSGQETFLYTASDGLVETLAATVTITVEAVNDVPVTVADSYTVDEDKLLVKSKAGGILANDSDAENDPLTALLVTGPANGVLNLNADGSFDYDSDQDFNGVDSFTYRAFDGTDSSILTTVTIDVLPIDDTPKPTSDSYTIAEDGQLVIAAPGVLDNDVEVDGETLTAILDLTVENGTLSLQPNGGFVYTPNPDFSGQDRFFYRASDGVSESSDVAVTITIDEVNDLPVALDDSYFGTEDVTLLVSAGVLENDSDVETNNLDAVLLTEPVGGMLVFDTTNGDFIFYPDPDWNGVTTFTYAATDGQDLSSPATVTITLAPVNDVVRVRVRGYTIDEDEVLSLPAPGLLARLRDPDGDQLSAVLHQDVNRGTLVLNADGSFEYTPDANDSGTMVFKFRADDGTELSNPGSVTITVLEVPDAPIGLPDSYVTTRDTLLSVPVSSGVLVNDSDGDGDPITAELLTNPANGTLTQFQTGGRFDYQPNAGYAGVDTFTYRATDGGLDSGPVTVTITVLPGGASADGRGAPDPSAERQRRAPRD